jgi:hypothetical protein
MTTDDYPQKVSDPFTTTTTGFGVYLFVLLHNISREGLKFMGVRQRGDQWC